MKLMLFCGSAVALMLAGACSGGGTVLSPTAGNPGVSPSAAAVSVDAVPFTGRFEGTQTVTPVSSTSATVSVSVAGTATHLGRFTMALPHTVNFATSTATGTATITAANGDTIVADFSGQAVPGPIVSIVEQATVVSGTGRFEGATGQFTITRQFIPAQGVTTGIFEGTISAPGSAHP